MGNVTYALACGLIKNGKARGFFTQSEIDWMTLYSTRTAREMANFSNGRQMSSFVDPQEVLDSEHSLALNPQT